ncbi:hypothetical protein SPV_2501 [Streptococcus pneumoniae]|nr:hypothetical protein SPV_2501 [Streptococcus pneumoniae]
MKLLFYSIINLYKI